MSKRRVPEAVELVGLWGDPLAPEPESDPWRSTPPSWWPEWQDRYARATEADPETYTPEAVDALDAEREEAVAAILSDTTEERHLTGLFAWRSHWVLVAVREYRGEVEPVRVEVRSYPAPDGELPKLRQVETLRQLPLVDFVAELRKVYMAELFKATTHKVGPRTAYPEDVQRRSDAARRLLGGGWWGGGPFDGPAVSGATKGPGGRKRNSIAHYKEVARVYSFNADGRPRRAVAEKWTVSESTAARWVMTARKLGLLPPTSRGIARGQSTDELAGERGKGER